MLVENNTIKTYKLISGEEIITIVRNNDKIKTIQRPLMFVLTNNQDKKSNDVIFAPWIISSDFEGDVHLNSDKIMAECDPSKIALEKYIEAIKGK